MKIVSQNERFVKPGLVSVIIACFNSEQHIAAALESALAQTYSEIELIVVDDASTDGSLAIVRSFEPRVKVIANRRNKERSWSRNKAVKNSHGEFIAFLDSDDVWEPDKLKKQITLFDDASVSVVYSNACFNDIHSDSKCQPILLYNSGRKNSLALPKDEPELALFVENPIVLSTAIVRKTAFDRVRGFALKRSILGAEDLDLWLRLALQGAGFAYLGEPLTFYRQHKAQTTRDTDVMCKCVCAVLRRHIRENNRVMQDKSCREAYAAKLKRLEASGVRAANQDNDIIKAVSSYLVLLHAKPTNINYWKGLARVFYSCFFASSVNRRI